MIFKQTKHNIQYIPNLSVTFRGSLANFAKSTTWQNTIKNEPFTINDKTNMRLPIFLPLFCILCRVQNLVQMKTCLISLHLPYHNPKTTLL